MLRLKGMDWKTPDFSTVSLGQKTLRVRLPYRPGSHVLDLLEDRTGIKFLGESESKRKMHEYQRQWRKVQLCIAAHALEVRAIEVTENAIGNAPCCPTHSTRYPVMRPSAAAMVSTTPRRNMRPLPADRRRQ